VANQPDVVVRTWTGEFSAINPADAPPGSAERLVNCAIRDQDKIEPLRGFDLLPGLTSVAPDPNLTTTAGVIDPKTFLFSAPTPGDPTRVAFSTFPQNTQIYSLDNNGLFSVPTSTVLSAGWDLGITAPSTSFSSSTIAMLKTVYLNTSRGLFKLDTPNPASTSQALIRPTQLNPLPITSEVAINTNNVSSYAIGTLSFGDARDWLKPGYTVAYRFVVGVKDPQGFIRLSEPSGRVLTTNPNAIPAGANVSPRLLIWPGQSIPSNLLSTTKSIPFVQIYRSQSMPPDSTGAAQNPSDEMFLVNEQVPPRYTGGSENFGYTSTYGTPGTFSQGHTYSDVTPDNQIYIPLYTNRGLGNGIQASKTNAPASNVLFSFGGRAYYGDTTNQQSLLIFLAGVSATGLQAGDTITVDGVTYTAVSSLSDAATRTFFAAAAGSPSSNIRLTALQLCDCINYNYLFANSALPYDRRVTADYISLGNGDEGQILLRRPVPGSPSFVVKTSATRGWAQDYTAGVNSDPSASPGGLQWSDLNQPDSVPLANQVVLGAPQDRVVAGVALRDYAIIFKEDGAWTVRESPRGPSFAPLDTTVRLVSPRCAVPLGNECVALTSQGVVSIGEYGVTNLSIPIQRELLTVLAANIGLFTGAFAVGYEAEKEYWLFLPSGRTGTTADLIKIYNQKTGAWTTGDFNSITAAIEAPTSSSSARQPSTALHMAAQGWGTGSSIGTYVVRELKSFTNSDYQLSSVTPTLAVGVTAFDGTATFTTTQTQYLSIIQPGSLLRLPAITGAQSTFVIQSVSLNAAQTTVTFTVQLSNPAQTFSGGNLVGAFIQPSVVSTIRQLPQTAGNPLLDKFWDGAGVYMWHRYCNTPLLNIGWETEKTQQQTQQFEPGPLAATWGFRPWNKTPWMRGAQDFVLNATIDNPNCRGGLLTQTVYYYNCQSRFELSAIDWNIASVSDRVSR
jgi:hypothetical protein